jgi:hypothetical protein
VVVVVVVVVPFFHFGTTLEVVAIAHTVDKKNSPKTMYKLAEHMEHSFAVVAIPYIWFDKKITKIMYKLTDGRTDPMTIGSPHPPTPPLPFLSPFPS